jgi:DNA-binding Xre family transcriptional regulator
MADSGTADPPAIRSGVSEVNGAWRWRCALGASRRPTRGGRGRDVRTAHDCRVGARLLQAIIYARRMAIPLAHGNKVRVPIRWKLKHLLDRHRISTYRFCKESGLSMSTAYRLARGEVSTLNAATIDTVIKTFWFLFEVDYELGDIVEYDQSVTFLVSAVGSVEEAMAQLVVRERADEYRAEIERLGVREAAYRLANTWDDGGLAFDTRDRALERQRRLASQGHRVNVLEVLESDFVTAWRGIGVAGRGSR